MEQAPRRAGHHDPADRARHEGRHGRLRPHHRARPRREDRRGLAGRRCAPTRASSRPTSGARQGDGHGGAARGRGHPHVLRHIEALKGISLTVNEGEIVTLIGSNGAGKSTTLRSISGLTPPRDGLDQLRGQGDPRACRPRTSCGSGSPSRPRAGACFPRMTVLENLELGAYLRRDEPTIERRPRARLRAVPAPQGARDARRRARCRAASSRCWRSAAR